MWERVPPVSVPVRAPVPVPPASVPRRVRAQAREPGLCGSGSDCGCGDGVVFALKYCRTALDYDFIYLSLSVTLYFISITVLLLRGAFLLYEMI